MVILCMNQDTEEETVEFAPRVREDVEGCPVYITSGILGKKWTILILQTLMAPRARNGLRFNAIQKDLSWISAKMLSQRLSELEEEDILTREVDSSVIPPHVSYTLTSKGEGLRGVLTLMQEWGMKHGGDKTGRCLGQGFDNCDGCRQHV